MFSFLENTIANRESVSTNARRSNVASTLELQETSTLFNESDVSRALICVLEQCPDCLSEHMCLQKVVSLLARLKDAECCVAINNLDPNTATTVFLLATEKGLDSMVRLLLENGADIDKPNDLGSTPLYAAAYNGQSSTVKLLLYNGADVTKANISNWTPLFAAAIAGHLDIVVSLLAVGAKLDIIDKDGVSPLILAVRNGHQDIVRYLLQAGAPLHTDGGTHGVTPLMVASYYGFQDIVAMLLTAGAAVVCKDREGNSSLYFAAQRGQTAVAQQLLDAGADVNACNLQGANALYVACCNNHLECATVLLRAGADANIRVLANAPGPAISSMAASEDRASKDAELPTGTPLIHTLCSSGYLSLIRLLFEESNVDVHSLDATQWSVLHIAASRGHANVVRLLLQKGVLATARNSEGCSALYLACQHGNTNVVMRLIEHIKSLEDTHINTPNYALWTPLFIASYNGHHDCAKLLLDAGADVHIANNNNCTCLFAASLGGHLSIIRLLLAAGASPNVLNTQGVSPLFVAVEEGHEEVAAVLLEGNADIYTTYSMALSIKCSEVTRASTLEPPVVPAEIESGEGDNNYTRSGSFYRARLQFPSDLTRQQSILMLNSTECMQRILQRKLKEDARKQHMLNSQFFTLVLDGDTDGAANLLLAYPYIDINHCDTRGWTPLFAAALAGHTDLVRLLLQHKSVNVNATTTYLHATPIYGACYAGNVEVIQLLVGNVECDVNKPDKHGVSPLIVAAMTRENTLEVLQALLGFVPVKTQAQLKEQEEEQGLMREAISEADDKVFSIPAAEVRFQANQNGMPAVVANATATVTMAHPPIPPSETAAASVSTMAENQDSNLWCKPPGWQLHVDVNKSDSEGKSALLMLADSGKLACVDLLLQMGANPNIVHEAGGWPLFVAVVGSHTTVACRLLMRSDALINKHDGEQGNTPLIEAVRHGNEELVHMLLERGGKVNVVNFSHCSPVYYAALFGYSNIVTMLLLAGANPNMLCGETRSSAMHAALEEGREEVAQSILQLSDGRATLLHPLPAYTLPPPPAPSASSVPSLVPYMAESDIAGQRDTIGLCCNSGSFPKQLIRRSSSLKAQQRSKLVESLIMHPFTINLQDGNGCTALWIACYRGLQSLVYELLSSGADINVQDKHDKRSALFVAAANGHVHLVRYLLQNGANPTICDYYGRSPAFITQGMPKMRNVFMCTDRFISAVKAGNLSRCLELNRQFGDIINVSAQSALLDIHDQGADGFCAVHAAAKFEYIDILKQLVEWGVDVNARSSNDWTPLMGAALENKFSCVHYLLSIGAAVDLRNSNGSTALFLAALRGHTEVVRLFLRDKPTAARILDLANDKGETPLYAASYGGFTEVVALLLQAGANVDATILIDGNSALAAAVLRGCLEVAKLIVDFHPHTVRHSNKAHYTPLMLATRAKKNDIANYLKEHGADESELGELSAKLEVGSENRSTALHEPGHELSILRRTITDDSMLSFSGVEHI